GLDLGLQGLVAGLDDASRSRPVAPLRVWAVRRDDEVEPSRAQSERHRCGVQQDAVAGGDGPDEVGVRDRVGLDALDLDAHLERPGPLRGDPEHPSPPEPDHGGEYDPRRMHPLERLLNLVILLLDTPRFLTFEQIRERLPAYDQGDD